MTVALPSTIQKRGLSLVEAADYCGVSPKTLGRHGPPATKIGGRCVYDRKVLDLWLDRLAGIAAPSAGPSDQSVDELQRAINARKNPVRHKAA